MVSCTDSVSKQIRAEDEAAMSEVSSTLGSGDALKSTINSALRNEGLEESTGVSAVASAPSDGTSDIIDGTSDISPAARLETLLWSLVVVLAALTLQVV